MRDATRLGPVAAALAALASTPVPAHAAGSGGFDLFGINPGLSIWTAVIFLVLLGILWKFGFGPLLEALASRESHIQDALDESAAKHAEAARLLEEHKQQLADARRQAQEIVAEGKAAGERVRRDIEAKAREEGQKLIARARDEIEREKDAALDELRRESVDLALAAASRLMAERMDSQRDRELVRDYLADLSDEAGRPDERGGAEA